MGAATSKNVVDQTLKVISNVASSVVNKTQINTDSTQLISIGHALHDVNISNNHFNIQVEVNMSELSKSFNTTAVQQDLSSQLQQTAKSLIKDINFGNLSDAENTVKSYVEETLTITNNLSNLCGSNTSTHQSIIIDTADTVVNITNNTFSSFQKIFSSCIADATSKNNAVQKLQNLIDQSATAETFGVSIWGFAAIIGIIVVGIAIVLFGPALLPLLLSGGKGGLMVGIVFLLIGAVLLLVWWFWSKRAAKTTLWAQPIANSCSPVWLKEIHDTSSNVQNNCISNKSCVGFYWANGTGTLYSSISANCNPQVDSTRLLVNRRVFAGDGPANSIVEAGVGDVYVNLTNATIVTKLDSGDWSIEEYFMQGLIESISEIKGITVATQSRMLRTGGWTMTTQPQLATFDFAKGITAYSIQGSGQKESTDPAAAAGIIYKDRKKWLLYTGIGFVAAGAIMSIVFGLRAATGKKTKDVKTKSKIASTNASTIKTV